jgi:hypothetical protein
VLALSDAAAAAALAEVPMSRADTCVRTRDALVAVGQTVRLGAELTDVDEVADARLVATGLDREGRVDSHFALAWREVTR